MIKKLLAAAAIGTAAQAGAADPVQILMQTSAGNIQLELYPDKAPATVANFVQYAQDGHYEGLIFHRVISGFMLQGGGYDADLRQRKTREPVRNEAKNGLGNERGTIAMARTSDPHSATSQFFINHADNRFLNPGGGDPHGYAVFGRVTEGMDVVDKIAAIPTAGRGMFRSDVPTETVVIEKVEVIGGND